MVSEGLVVRETGRRWSFEPTLDTVQSRQASYQFRQVLEPAGILCKTFVTRPEELIRLRLAHNDLLGAINNGNAARSWIYETDAAFHETVASFSGNQFFLNAVVQQNRLRQILELRNGRDTARVRMWCNEHLLVIDALERTKYKQAAKRMHDHLQSAWCT